jgi:hypothetical protein
LKKAVSPEMKNLTVAGWILTILTCAVTLICCILVLMWLNDGGYLGMAKPFYVFLAMPAVIAGGIFFWLGKFLLSWFNIRVFRQQERKVD